MAKPIILRGFGEQLRSPTEGVRGVRVSGGHLCEAEAPTEPTGETQSLPKNQ